MAVIRSRSSRAISDHRQHVTIKGKEGMVAVMDSRVKAAIRMV